MQDITRPHRNNRVLEVLKEHSGERILALGYPETNGMGIAWPSYSPDVNPCNSFLWGNIKDKVCANDPETIAENKTAIQEIIECMDVSTLQRIMQNSALRLRHIIAINGKHIEHVKLNPNICSYFSKLSKIFLTP